jgi:hypothetical protein
MDPNTTSAIRDIFVIVAAGVFSLLCLTVVVLVFKLYRPVRDSVHNASGTTENLNRITTEIAAVSGETASNIVQVSRNAVTIIENLKEGSEDLSSTVKTAREAANNVAAAASTVGTIAETVSRFSTLGVSGGGSAGVGTILRLLRNVFGPSRRSDDGSG